RVHSFWSLTVCKSGQFTKTRRTLDDVCAFEHPVDHLILEHASLDLTHGLRTLQVRTSHLVRIRISRGNLVEARLHPLPVHLKVRRPNDLAHDQPQCHPAPRRLLES